jgi:alkanesulfonate monooxygenase SsuD/methylene tetrahydromethanopterin reductase-like flavin-dependent oxidoreductase (luciferase family)
VKVGIYLDLRNPPQWRQPSSRLYGFTLELCEEAEHLGASSIWVTEHHLFEDGYLTQPLTFAAAIAARTTRVRVGTAVLVAPFRSAVQIAEEATVVDILSDGRLELGLGAGYRIPEYELFGADIATRYKTTDARARDVRAIWDEGRLTPAPVQARPPIWLGYQGPKGARRCGLLGESLLSAQASSWDPYRQGLVEAGHDPGRARMTGGFQGFVTEDPEGDWPTVARHITYMLDTYRHYAVEGTGAPEPRAIDPERALTRETSNPLAYYRFGTPEQMAGWVAEHVGDAPVGEVYFFASIAGMAEDLVMRHVRTLCTSLAPLLADVGAAVS